MALQGANQAVAAGATSATVAGAFPSIYQVGITTGWVTGVRVTSKSATQFTVQFAVPAPAGGSAFDWTAGAPVSPASGASPTIAVGLTTVTVTGIFSVNYQVAVGPGWLTDYDVVSKTGTSFVINFATPVPAGGSTFDWIAVILEHTILGVVASTPIAGASQFIAAGATSLAVSTFGNLPAVYEVTVAPGWVTSHDVVNKTASGFTINFAVPVPAGGSTVDWIIFGPNLGASTLLDYLTELRDLLHDPLDRYWSQTQKARYITQAMRRRDMDTAANRTVMSFTLTAGTGSYTLAQVGNGQVFDVVNVALIVGATRVILQQLSLTELNIKFRPWTTLRSQPWSFARVGPSQVIFGPTPGIAYVSEWDVCAYTSPLVSLTDTDPLPYPYTHPVPFYAAYLAKINERQSDEAMEFLDSYTALINVATNSRMGRNPAPYSGIGIGRG